jgi:hypothetical protein
MQAKYLFVVLLHSMISGFLVISTEWRVLELREEEKVSGYGG